MPVENSGKRKAIDDPEDHQRVDDTRQTRSGAKYGAFLVGAMSENARINIWKDKGIIIETLVRWHHKDEVHLSDLQRYTCITDDWREIPINWYESRMIRNDNTLEIVNALHHANVKLSSGKVTYGTLNLTRESAAFMPFLGTEVNLSRIFLARDLGLSIQSVAIQGVGRGAITLQSKFAPDGQSIESHKDS